VDLERRVLFVDIDRKPGDMNNCVVTHVKSLGRSEGYNLRWNSQIELGSRQSAVTHPDNVTERVIIDRSELLGVNFNGG
jgi:hypothetical protein